jgi:hypothetical protein
VNQVERDAVPGPPRVTIEQTPCSPKAKVTRSNRVGCATLRQDTQLPAGGAVFSLPFAYIEDCLIVVCQTLRHGDRLVSRRETADKLLDVGQDGFLIARESPVIGAVGLDESRPRDVAWLARSATGSAGLRP